jgi:hypothetical protein
MKTAVAEVLFPGIRLCPGAIEPPGFNPKGKTS